MTTRIVCTLVAVVATTAMALGQHQAATVGEYSGLSQVRDDGVHSPARVVRCASVTGYYYYSGNFDSTNVDANGLANEADTMVNTGSQVYQPFSVVSKGKRNI